MTSEQQQVILRIKQLLMQSQYQSVISSCNEILAAKTAGTDHILIKSLQLPLELTPALEKETLYLKAVACRMYGEHTSAIATLNLLIEQFPDYGRAHQELGYCFSKTDQKKAAYCFYQATQFNPALLSSWLQLENVYNADSQQQALTLCRQQITFLKALPKPVLGATDLMYEGQLHKADQVCRQFLQEQPHHPDAMMLLAEIGVQLKAYSDAEFLLESCVTLYPDNDKAAMAYQTLLAKLGKFPQAVKIAEQRLAKAPDSFSVKVGLAHALVGVGDLQRATDIYQRLLNDSSDRPAIWVALGHALKAKGDTKEAVTAYETAIEHAGDFGDAYWSLANTKTYKFTPALLAQMATQVSKSSISLEDKIHICFALGRGYEDRGDAELSFHYYQLGNSLKKRTLQFDIRRTESALQAQKSAFAKKDFNKASGCQATDPIFIVGLPRAGSTLLEQILASHSKVDGTMELHDVLGIASSLSQHATPYPMNVTSLNDEILLQLGEKYLSQTQAYRQQAPFFIDKMPNNFIHIGLIKKILPNAKIIDARRNPMDCCFSGYKQLFGEGQEFSYSLSDIGRYYNAYKDLMEHWHKVLPGEILTVHHEDVLDDLEGEVKRILAFCGLEFEEACLAFHKTKRVIKTPSSEQVRQPLYKTGLGQWRPFNSFLTELKQELRVKE